MGRMDADMLAAVNAEGSLIAPVLTIAWPDETRRYSYYPYVGPAGLAAPKTIRDHVRTIGEVQESVSDEEFQLTTTKFTVTLSDDDDNIASRLARGYELVGANAWLDVAVQGLVETKWLRAWTGILGDTPQLRPNERAFDVALRSNDLPLLSFFPRHPIQRYDWPFVDKDALNAWAPIIYGLHDSRTLGGDGAVPLFYVKNNANPFRYLICQGWLRALLALYQDGTRLISTAYTLVRGVVNGRPYTWVEFTTSQGASVFTADVEGLAVNADGTGALLANTATVLKHLLVNFVYNEPLTVLSGGTPVWRSDSEAPIAASTFAAGAAVLDSLVYTGDACSAYFGGEEQSTGVRAINDACASALASVQFDNLGLLAFVIEDLSLAPSSGWDQTLDYPTPEVGRSFHPATRSEQLFSRAVARYGNLVTRASELQIECEVQARFEATETLELPWGPHFA